LKKQKLILLTGTPSVGKTKTCELLYKSFPNSAYFDGDWAWCVNPFSLEDPRLRNGDKNISFVLNTYLESKFDYIFCSSVLFMFPEIRESILNGISFPGYEILVFHLRCSKDQLAVRHYGQGLTYEPAYQWLNIDVIENDIMVNTDNKTISDVCNELENIIDRPLLFLETKRLILRTVTERDIELVAESMNIDGQALSTEEAQKEITWMRENHDELLKGHINHLCLAITLKGQKEIIGWCGIDKRKEKYLNPVLYYLLKEKYWNNGYATEAANNVLKYCFNELNIEQIDAGVDKENIASKKVLEKIGMNYIGIDDEGGYSYSKKNIEVLT